MAKKKKKTTEDAPQLFVLARGAWHAYSFNVDKDYYETECGTRLSSRDMAKKKTSTPPEETTCEGCVK